MAAGPVQPLLKCGNETACPPVLHDLRHGTVAPCQAWCQHDGSTYTGCEADQRDPQRGFAHAAFFKDRSVNQHVMLADLDILSAADHCRMATLVNMRDRPLGRPPQQYTYTMTRARRNSALSCQRRMHQTTWELPSGRACALGTLGASAPARAMGRRCRTACASAPNVHQHAQRQPCWAR